VSAPKLTPWFRPEVKPVRPGWYDVRNFLRPAEHFRAEWVSVSLTVDEPAEG